MDKMTRAESLARACEGSRRKKQERMAQELRDRGWTVISPYAQVSQEITETSTCHGVDLHKRAAA